MSEIEAYTINYYKLKVPMHELWYFSHKYKFKASILIYRADKEVNKMLGESESLFYILILCVCELQCAVA